MPRQNKPHVSCGARSKRTGEQCQAKAMPNGKCYHHGGATTGAGAPVGNTNAKTHGLYSKSLGSLGVEVYGKAKGLTPDEIARDTAEFLVAKVAEAYHVNPDADGLLFQMIAQLEDSGDITEDEANAYRSKLASPRIEALGKVLAPLKGLLEVKAPSDASTMDDPLLGLVDALQRSRNNA